MNEKDAVNEARLDRRFFGHPIGLMPLFNTELWERFSYYGMRAILLYFLTDQVANQGMGLSTPVGKALVATYSSSVFLLSVIGGWLSDRLWGPRKTTLYGGLVIICGHICLAIPLYQTAYLGIVLVALGSGILKPNISTMVGELYSEEDPRRDSAFSIFYLGINLGSFFSPLVVGWVRGKWGYHAGFSVAAIGMAIALGFFIWGHRHLDERADRVPNPIPPARRLQVQLGVLGCLAALVVLWIALKLIVRTDALNTTINIFNLLALLMPIGYFAMMFHSKKVTRAERSRLTAFIPLFLAAAMFWMIFEQAASSMADYAEKNTDLRLGSLQIDPELYQSINPLFIILLSGVFAAMWIKLKGRPSTATKFAIGLGLGALSFAFLGTMTRIYAGGLAPWWVLFITFVIQTVGELFLSPVGLAATTLLTPRAFKSQGMALFLLASAFGQAITAQIFARLPHLSKASEFFLFAAIAGTFTVILVLLIPWINRNIQAGQAEDLDSDPNLELLCKANQGELESEV